MSSRISANSLFHFTRESKYLMGILEHGIFIRYSLESYGKLLRRSRGLLLPMACFCDIPLSNIEEHIEKYGSYGIGFTKEWGMKNGLSPVLYAHENSETAKILNTLNDDVSDLFDIDEHVEETDSERRMRETHFQKYQEKYSDLLLEQIEKREEFGKKIAHFLKYIKPYSGIGYSNGEKFDQVNFYNEREWRYVPPKELLEEIEVKDTYGRSFYHDERKRRFINMKLAVHKKLEFEPNDIKFILVKNDSEIPKMIEAIRAIFGPRATHNDMMLLTTRLISVEHILNDF